jgi:hypothetical protein
LQSTFFFVNLCFYRFSLSLDPQDVAFSVNSGSNFVLSRVLKFADQLVHDCDGRLGVVLVHVVIIELFCDVFKLLEGICCVFDFTLLGVFLDRAVMDVNVPGLELGLDLKRGFGHLPHSKLL